MRPSQRKPAAPPAPAPSPKATAEEVERALERRRTLQAALTREVHKTAAAYREVREVQGDVLSDAEMALPRYRNPHDRVGEYDRLDRRDPALPTVPLFVLAIPGFKQRTRLVPDSAVAEYGEDDDGEFALLDCPCGSKPVVRRRLERCQCCERYYMLGRGRPLVFYGAMTPPWLTAVEEKREHTTCQFEQCDGSGFLIDEGTNTASDCRCRAGLIEANRRRAALVD